MVGEKELEKMDNRKVVFTIHSRSGGQEQGCQHCWLRQGRRGAEGIMKRRNTAWGRNEKQIIEGNLLKRIQQFKEKNS